nr:hypothetical protein Iba_scaffold40623CG0010 [Ipomoea batatas]
MHWKQPAKLAFLLLIPRVAGKQVANSNPTHPMSSILKPCGNKRYFSYFLVMVPYSSHSNQLIIFLQNHSIESLKI